MRPFEAAGVAAVATVIVGGTVGLYSTLSTDDPAAEPTSPSRRLVEELNRVRRRHHLTTVVYSLRQSRGALAWSRHLARTGVPAHDSTRRTRPADWRSEAIAWTTGHGTARQTVGQWLASPPHRRILLAAGVDAVGAGRAEGRYAVYWTLRSR